MLAAGLLRPPSRVTSAHVPGLSASPAAAAYRCCCRCYRCSLLAPSFPALSPCPALSALLSGGTCLGLTRMPRAALGTRAALWPDLGIFLFPVCWRGSPLSSLPCLLCPPPLRTGVSREREAPGGSGITQIHASSSVWLTLWSQAQSPSVVGHRCPGLHTPG